MRPECRSKPCKGEREGRVIGLEESESSTALLFKVLLGQRWALKPKLMEIRVPCLSGMPGLVSMPRSIIAGSRPSTRSFGIVVFGSDLGCKPDGGFSWMPHRCHPKKLRSINCHNIFKNYFCIINLYYLKSLYTYLNFTYSNSYTNISCYQIVENLNSWQFQF